MKVALLTREYPPDVYGGAGVHVTELTKALRHLVEVEVHCFGAPDPRRGEGVISHPAWEALSGDQPEIAALSVLSVDLSIAAAISAASVAHSHTWYANFAGHLGKLCWGTPHVATAHSLEPLRPWKAEQLGGGYAVSRFIERTAFLAADALIAVSRAMRSDILACYPELDPAVVEVIYNGIDPEQWQPDPGQEALISNGVDPSRPYVLFVGRITRQKGLNYLLDAASDIDRRAQLVLCAGAPDTPEIAEETRRRVAEVTAERGQTVWIESHVDRQALCQLLTNAAVFVCPSVYEPFGLVNLEAMACGCPVVASAVGGIPEVVVDGETGYLVPLSAAAADGSAVGPQPELASGLALRINQLLDNPELASRMGAAGRERVVTSFSWEAVARQTVELYARVMEKAGS